MSAKRHEQIKWFQNAQNDTYDGIGHCSQMIKGSNHWYSSQIKTTDHETTQ